MAFEEIGDAGARGVFDEIVKINEAPGELTGELSADGRFAGTHEAGEGDDGCCGSAGHARILVEGAGKVERRTADCRMPRENCMADASAHRAAL